MTEYYVGQEMLIRSVNQRGREPERATVTKVGRKLVTVHVGAWNREEVYRIEDSKRNDNYGHEWLQTPEAYAESQRRTELWAQMRELGWVPDHGYRYDFTHDQLERIIAILKEES